MSKMNGPYENNPFLTDHSVWNPAPNPRVKLTAKQLESTALAEVTRHTRSPKGEPLKRGT